MADNTINTVFTATDKVSPTVNKLKTNISKLGGPKTGPLGNMAAGFGAGAVAGLGAGAAFGMLTDTLQGVGRFLGDATNAAIKDAESQERMKAALKANVPLWDGNTDAIERFILKQQRLGFADEDLRTAMSFLVGATHDVTKAQIDLSIAEDLARFKGISVQQASEALVKVEGGRYKLLASLGIQLHENATAEEALAAVQAVTAGQAEAHANTTIGKLEAADLRIGEMQESIGANFIPVMNSAITYVDNFGTSAEHAFGQLQDLFDPGGIAGRVAEQERQAWLGRTDAMQGEAQHYAQVAEAEGEDSGRGFSTSFSRGVMSVMQKDMKEASDFLAHSARGLDGDLAGALKGNKSVIDDAMDAVTWAIKHPMALTRQLANIEGAITTLEYKRGLAGNTEGINTVIDQQIQVLKDAWSDLEGVAWDAGHDTHAKWNSGFDSVKDIGFRGPARVGGREVVTGRAAGGEIGSGGWSMVGERGPELIRAGRHGATVSPNVGGGPIIVNVDGRELFRIMDERLGKRLAMTSSNAYTRG